MLYTFDDAAAQDRHLTQYFELTGTRAIYHEGWWAGTRHGRDGVTASKGDMPFDQDVWELYNTRTDFGHATNLAAEHPDKLKELQALFDREARRYNVYPMADDVSELLTAERPKLVTGNKASYGPGTVRLPEDAAINIKNRSFSLIAEVENSDGDAEGTLVTLAVKPAATRSWSCRASRPSITTGSVGSGTRSPLRSRCPRANARSSSTSPTTAAAWARAEPAR